MFHWGVLFVLAQICCVILICGGILVIVLELALVCYLLVTSIVFLMAYIGVRGKSSSMLLRLVALVVLSRNRDLLIGGLV